MTDPEFIVGTNAHSNIEGLAPVLEDEDEDTEPGDGSGEDASAAGWQAKSVKKGSS